jgi:hypothetical protein
LAKVFSGEKYPVEHPFELPFDEEGIAVAVKVGIWDLDSFGTPVGCHTGQALCIPPLVAVFPTVSDAIFPFFA